MHVIPVNTSYALKVHNQVWMRARTLRSRVLVPALGREPDERLRARHVSSMRVDIYMTAEHHMDQILTGGLLE